MTIQEKINNNTITGIKFLEELYSKTTGKYTNSGYKPYKEVNAINLSFINTIYFSEALCKRYDLNLKDEKTFQPELGLMLIKKILYDSLNLELLTPKLLVSIFNKNQELIEIPYIYALYLGGLHYFNTNENIGLKRNFASTNNIKVKGVKTNNIYDIYDIYKIITRDSYYKSKKTIEFNNDEKNDKGEDIKVNIQNLSTLNGLACGYGIQHNFLNKYYELLFNKPISEDKGKPYAMIGGYNGIIKPLIINSSGYNKYTVNDSIDSIDPIDFIGLYRNVCVTERAFTNITDNEIINDVKNSDFFLAYSKLKAKYLSGLYDDIQFKTICEELDNFNFSYFLFNQIFKQNFFGSKINDLIDEADNNTTKMISVLRKMWTLEKNNMLNQYSNISKSTYCLIPSAGGIINFDSTLTLTIDELKSELSNINYGFLCNLQKILWFEDNLSVESLMFNIKNDNGGLPIDFFQRNTFTDSVEEINPGNKNLLYYFNTLLDSLDIEKLEYFTDLFKDFCDMKQKNNDNGYTLRSLLLGITTIGYDDISDTSVYMNDKRVTFTKDDINLLLIGNSVYTYDSFYDDDISMALNIALTQAQYNNYQKIRKDFLNNKITIANLSTIGPLKYNTSPELSLHKIITLPEIMFSNANNYEEVIANINKINKNNDKESNLFLTRRLLFNNQFVENFSVLETWENKELRELNNIYMIHPSLLKGNKNLDDITNIIIKFDDITNIVIKFFETLNIKYSKNNYLLLLRLIRGFVYYYYNTKGEIEIRLN